VQRWEALFEAREQAFGAGKEFVGGGHREACLA
jgi:hypothetical protein